MANIQIMLQHTLGVPDGVTRVDAFISDMQQQYAGQGNITVTVTGNESRRLTGTVSGHTFDMRIVVSNTAVLLMGTTTASALFAPVIKVKLETMLRAALTQ